MLCFVDTLKQLMVELQLVDCYFIIFCLTIVLIVVKSLFCMYVCVCVMLKWSFRNFFTNAKNCNDYMCPLNAVVRKLPIAVFEDGKWQRGIVLSSEANGLFRVFCVDVGWTATSSLSQIR